MNSDIMAVAIFGDPWQGNERLGKGHGSAGKNIRCQLQVYSPFGKS
jgi:hypothetical protein